MTNRVPVSVVNAAVRIFSLAARFVLALVLAKYFPLEQIGLYGVMYSLTAGAPAVLGFGANFFLNREIVLMPLADALCRIRDRLGVSATLAALATPLIGLSLWAAAHIDGQSIVLFLAIFVLEVVALDLHFSLISLKRPVLANSLLFVRSALWIYPFSILVIYFPEYRSLNYLLGAWFASLLLCFLVVVVVVRSWPLTRFSQVHFDADWFRTRWRRAGLIYLSDLGIVGTMFLDRFILGAVFSLKEVGVYVFFWTIANAVQIIVATAVTQIALPHMIEAFHQGGQSRLLPVVHKNTKIAGMLGCVIALLAFATMQFILPLIGRAEFSSQIPIFATLLVGAVVKGMADVWNIGIYSAGMDRAWALINISGVLVMACLGYVACVVWGMQGLAVSTVLVVTGLLLARSLALRQDAGAN